MCFKLNVALLVKFILIIDSIDSCQLNPNRSLHKEDTKPNLCNFFDTINITDGIQNADDSITFDKVRYTIENYGTFNYTYLPNKFKVAVDSHVRGCVCKYKSCVRLCCPYGYSLYVVVIENQLKQTCVSSRGINSLFVEILHEGEKNQIDLMHSTNITLVSAESCKLGHFLEHLDKWTVLSNGSIIIGEGNYTFIANREEYCIAHAYQNNTGGYHVKVMFCTNEDEQQLLPKPTILDLIYPVIMLVSVVFLLLTLFAYIWIEQLRRTVQGKNLMCYLATLIVFYSFLAFTLIDNSHSYKGATKCLIIAEIIHTAFISGFIWLSIISFDIWKWIGRTDNQRNQFKTYFLFVCGLTLVILLLTNLLDNITYLPINLRPGLGTAVCWLQDTRYAQFLYLYSLIILVITLNTVLFILTRLKIQRIRKMFDLETNSGNSRKFSRDETDADAFGLFLRLFVIMGIPWIIEITSFLLDVQHVIIYVLDVTTMLQGPIIFFLFITKRYRVNQREVSDTIVILE